MDQKAPFLPSSLQQTSQCLLLDTVLASEGDSDRAGLRAARNITTSGAVSGNLRVTVQFITILQKSVSHHLHNFYFFLIVM